MRFLLLLWWVGAPVLAFNQMAYRCPPCITPCDTLAFTAPGACPACGMTLTPAPPEAAAAATDDPLLSRILAEGKAHSQLADHLYQFTDLIGPRLMGTEGYRQAAWYVNSLLLGWEGVDRIAFESFDDGYRGWSLSGHSLALVKPHYEALPAFPRTYTSGTDSAVTAEVIYVPHSDQLDDWRGRLRGKAVMLGDQWRATSGPVDFSRRTFTEAELAAAAANPDPNHRLLGYMSRRATPAAIADKIEREAALAALHRQLRQLGVVALLEPSQLGSGIIKVDGWGMTPAYVKKGAVKPLPAWVLSRSAFAKIKRLAEAGRKPRVRLALDAAFTEADRYQVNVIAELRGHDPAVADELIVLGAHLDSWQAGAGATDNAGNCATLLETIRILDAIDARPRRTIRLVLWGGHEQNFLGSRHYISSRLGALDGSRLGGEHELTSLYLNLDNGAGRIRGLYLMGNDRIRPLFAQWLQPFPQSGTLTRQRANQSDHELFDWMGIPAFQFIQDPLNYIPVTHHTQLDQPEHLDTADLQYNAELLAYLAMRAADAEQRMPRKPHHAPAPLLDGNARIFLPGFAAAEAVSVVGDFNNWVMHDTKLARVAGGWECRLILTPGRYLYKFIVDDRWTADPAAEQLFEDEMGHTGLAELIVK